MKSRLTASLLTLTLFSTPSLALAAAPISDIAGHWAAPTIQNYVERGIIHGYEDHSFRPDAPISRAEFLSLLIRVTGLNLDNIRFIKAPEVGDVAPDVGADAYYAQELIIAGFFGVVENHQPFRPDAPIERQEMAHMAVKALYAKAGPIMLTQQFIQFADADAISPAYMGDLQDAYKLGILVGHEMVIRPKDGVTRAEGVTVLTGLEKTIEAHLK